MVTKPSIDVLSLSGQWFPKRRLKNIRDVLINIWYLQIGIKNYKRIDFPRFMIKDRPQGHFYDRLIAKNSYFPD